MKFSVFQLSRRGGRVLNEDRMGFSYTREAVLFVVADGMGGHPEGEVAAQIALQSVSVRFKNKAQPVLEDPQAFLSQALIHAHEQILQYARDKGMKDAPRTTLVAAVAQHGRICWIHCGDSRLYLMRDGELVARTRDHSYSEREELTHYFKGNNRNVLFTCLGSNIRPLFDLSDMYLLSQGDKVLLCSDGLWSSISELELLKTMQARPVDRAVPLVVDSALRRAGKNSDNVTAVAMEWETPDLFEASASISTDEQDEHMFSTTIQGLDALEAEDEFDDAVIDRSIAEINEAIRRSGQR